MEKSQVNTDQLKQTKERRRNVMLMHTTNAVDGKSAVAQVELCACAWCKPVKYIQMYTPQCAFHFIRIKQCVRIELAQQKTERMPTHIYIYKLELHKTACGTW